MTRYLLSVHPRILALSVAAAFLLLAIGTSSPGSVYSAELTFTVNQTGDQLDADTGDNVCDVDLVSGGLQCTLRAAIEQANANFPWTDTIAFNCGPPCTIQPTASLPVITDPVIIDGTTQPGYAGTPLIHLNGILTGAGVDGLRITAGNTTVKGLLIQRFPGDGIEVTASGNNTVVSNFIGTDSSGNIVDPDPGNGDEFGNLTNGILINASPNNTIGGTTAAERNIIGGNGRNTNQAGDGIEISGAGATGNKVIGNYIGIGASGGAQVGNRAMGVLISGVGGNTIGGTAAGERNIISANREGGVEIIGANATGNTVLGNYIGTNAAGTDDRGNTGAGVKISSAPSNTIGGTGAGSRNVLSGNSQGIQIQQNGATGNQVLGNYIGPDASGGGDIGNGIGILVIDAPGNAIGGTAAGASNVISGNAADGIHITGSGATSNVISGNFIGTNPAGTDEFGDPFPPQDTGIRIDGSSNNTIGGTSAAARNIISGNFTRGVEIKGTSASGNQVQGNYIGTDVNGTAAVPNGAENGGSGVLINGSDNNVVGGTAAGARNVISGNGLPFLSPGVEIAGAAGTGNLVQGNYIGVDATGAAPLPNVGEGVVIFGSPGNTIGGTSTAARNVISANALVGIEISGATATGNLVQGNHIGLDASGAIDLGNGNSGVFIGDAGSNTIGGTAAGARNVISGNDSMGIEVVNPGSIGNAIQGNYIGTDAAGTQDKGNTLYGVYINGGSSTTVGGTSAAARNVISGNNTGVFINASNNNFVRGNFIGLDATGSTNNVAVQNAFDGVRIGGESTGNQVGGSASGAGNTIALNGGDGVRIDNGTGNAVLGNGIHTNGELGIDLANDGADNNDAGDPDTGANNRQNYPVITSAQTGSIRVQGTLNSAASTLYRLEFFFSPTCDGTGKGEGRTFIGSSTTTTNVSGNATFDSTFFSVTPAVGDWITSTATDPANNTSEFSSCFQVTAGPPIPTPTASPVPTPGPSGASYYRPVTPARILDTRTGVGSVASPIPGGTSRTIQVAGVGGVPASGAASVVLNVTVTAPTNGGFLTVYPSDASLPVASNLNFLPGQTVPNLVTVRLGGDGKVKVFNSSGSTHVIFDVAGWYGEDPGGGARYNPVNPSRILDTRNGTGGIIGPVGPGPANTKSFQVAGKGGVPASATAVVLNTTITGPTDSSFLTLHPANESLPVASNLNYTSGKTVPNLVIVKLSPGGSIHIYNNAGSVHVILDVAGWFEGSTGNLFTGVNPARLMDTRTGAGGFVGKIPPGGDVTLDVTGVGGIPASGVAAVALNVTVTEPTSPGFLTAYPSGTSRPVVSNLNFTIGQTVPNAVIVRVGADGLIRIYNSSGSTHVVVDVAGYYGP